MTDWGDLDARAAGLATRLLPRPALEALAAAPDLPALVPRLEQAAGLELPGEARADPAVLDHALRRLASAGITPPSALRSWDAVRKSRSRSRKRSPPSSRANRCWLNWLPSNGA